MALFENFPYTNLHDLNLDWVIEKIKESAQAVADSKKDIEKAKAEIEEMLQDLDVVIDGKIEEAIVRALEDERFEELIAAVANQNIYFCVYPDMTQAAIQTAINEHTAIKFTPGTYRIYIPEVRGYGYLIPSNRLIFFDDATILRVGDVEHEYDSVLTISQAENVKLYGNGIINYNREIMQLASGEHGMCLSIAESSKVAVEGLSFVNGFGDGIYLNDNDEIYINNVRCNNNRRNGISIICGSNYTIENSIFSNSSGTAPQAGIAIETNFNTDRLYNININNCRCFGNAAERDCYITVFSNNGSIKLNNVETENTIPVTLRGTKTSVIIQNCSMKTKATSHIFLVETGSDNTIVFEKCSIDGTAGANSLISYTGSVFENLFIKNTIIYDAILSGRAVLALGTLEDVGNIYVDLITKNVSIDTPATIIRSTRANPVIYWSIENMDVKPLPADTVLIFNNYTVNQTTRLTASPEYLKQKIRIKNIANAASRIISYIYSPFNSQGTSLDIPANKFTDIQPYADGFYVLTIPSNVFDASIQQVRDNTIMKIDSLTVQGNSSASFTLPSNGVYMLVGSSSPFRNSSVVFIIGGYVSASRCLVTNLTGQTSVTIDNTDTTALNFSVSNGGDTIALTIYKLA